MYQTGYTNHSGYWHINKLAYWHIKSIPYEKDDISRLLQRYLSAREMGKEPYFDADEVDELLGSFEESDNYDYFDEVLALGLKLHPGNI